MGRPRPWLWLLAWAYLMLLSRAIYAGFDPYIPPIPSMAPLEGSHASPFDDPSTYDCSTSSIPLSPDSRGWNNHLR